MCFNIQLKTIIFVYIYVVFNYEFQPLITQKMLYNKHM